MHFSSVAAFAVAIPAAAAAAYEARHVLHERRYESADWIKAVPVKEDALLPMRIGLTQNNLHQGHDLLMEVYERTWWYGKYYSAEEIHDLFAPSADSVAAVLEWLENHGIDMRKVSQSYNKQWIQFDAEAAEAESLLKTKFHLYEHAATGKLSVGCDEYHVHEHVQPHIDYVTPGVKLLATSARVGPKNQKRNFRNSSGGWVGPIKTPLSIPVAEVGQAQKNGSLAHCGDLVTPSCLFAMYNMTQPTKSVPGNNLGIFEDQAEYIDSVDLNEYYKYLAPQIPNGTFPILHGIDGAVNKDNVNIAGAEACLDFTMAYPLIYPQQTVLFITDDDYYEEHYTYNGFFNNFLDGIDGSYCNYTAFGEAGNSPIDPPYPDPHKEGYKGQLQCGVWKPTHVISLSYALAELEGGVPRSYLQRQCSEYMKLGMQGVSLVFASGDYGVSCTSYYSGENITVFDPYFPSSCPYITSVGATYLPPGKSAVKDEERATTQFASGGGFSNIFPRPAYQKKAVEGFFNAPNAPKFPYYTGQNVGKGLYNRTGRGAPDVSANGQGFVSFCNGQPEVIGGTSASTPLFASILTRINGERITAGKPPVGFVNPLLYQNPQAFHDIVLGSNSGCENKGFRAGEGWDPVTGLGTPNYPALLDVFMKASS